MEGPHPGRPLETQRTAVAALCVVGLAALLSSEWCVDLAERFAGATHTVGGDAIFRLTFALGCALAAVRARDGKGPTAPLPLQIAMIAGLLVGQALYILAPLAPLPGVAKIAGGILLGPCSAAVLIGWLSRCCSAEPRLVAVTLSAAYLLTGAIYFILAALHPAVAAAIVVLLPCASGILYFALQRSSGTQTPMGHGQGSWPFPVRPVALAVAFALAFNLSLAFSTGASMYGPLGILVVSAATLALALFSRDGFNPSALFKLSVPCMIAGLLMISWVNLGANVATLFSNAGNIAFELFILITLADACRRYAVSPFWLFGIVEGASYAATCAGKLLGNLLTNVYPAGSPESGTVVMAAVVGLVALCSFFPGERLALRTFGGEAEKGTGKEDDALGELSGMALLCATASRRYGLSRREEEILGLLLQGMSAGQIEEELAISRSTVKSHIQHIYEKTGVHSRDELRALVAAPKEAPDPGRVSPGSSSGAYLAAASAASLPARRPNTSDSPMPEPSTRKVP